MTGKEHSFVWDPAKEAVNVEKHGVDFSTAARAFGDTGRKILIDVRHGQHEERLICLGKVDGRVLTVRFVYRENQIRIVGAGYWRKGAKHYDQEN